MKGGTSNRMTAYGEDGYHFNVIYDWIWIYPIFMHLLLHWITCYG